MRRRASLVRGSGDDPWIGWDGEFAHPDAPAGGGGPGHFRRVRALGTAAFPVAGVPDPQAPVARYVIVKIFPQDPTYYTFQRVEESEGAEVHWIESRIHSGKQVLYGAIPHYEPLSLELELEVNEVRVVVKNSTVMEREQLWPTLEKMPTSHLEILSGKKGKGIPIVFKDWIKWPNGKIQLTGGGYLNAEVQITHTAMTRDVYQTTVLHEVGHVMYSRSLYLSKHGKPDAIIVPLTVEGTYGKSSHEGEGEQVAYAHAAYILKQWKKFSTKDKKAFGELAKKNWVW